MHTYYYRQCPNDHYPYVIQPGDTLNYIALRLEKTVFSILAANPGLDPHNLRIGQSICIPACPPNHTSKIIEQGDTLYQIAQNYQVTIESILEANPSVDPNSLRVGQRLCIPSACGTGFTDERAIIQAMQHDINMLKKESHIQQTKQANYGKSTRTTAVLKATKRELQFEDAPVVFSGNYEHHFTTGQKYAFYKDASMGGQRGISVRDNFGVWHTFNYRV